MEKEWFATWFDSPYYHVLYKCRDEKEAGLFIDHLVGNLDLTAGTRVLDLACGRGRHSVTLHRMGYDVLGVDLSPESISEAQKKSSDKLQFRVHDMRLPIPGQTFGAVFNLFTSFGYFDSMDDNRQVIRSVHSMLEPNGLFVLDFMNTEKIVRSLVASEEKEVDGIRFQIERKFDGEYICKDIRFSDNGQAYQFCERVQALTPDDFQRLFAEGGFRILQTFGDFALSPFDVASSDRFIIIAQKNSCKSS